MISITKDEAAAVRVKFPNAHIVRTMKQKSGRHRYYCEENRGVMRYIEYLRNTGVLYKKNKGAANSANRKKASRV